MCDTAAARCYAWTDSYVFQQPWAAWAVTCTGWWLICGVLLLTTPLTLMHGQVVALRVVRKCAHDAHRFVRSKRILADAFARVMADVCSEQCRELVRSAACMKAAIGVSVARSCGLATINRAIIVWAHL